MTTQPTSRRTLLTGAVALGAVSLTPLGAGVAGSPTAAATAGTTGPIQKPLPPGWFLDYGSNAEMRWDSVDPHRYLVPQSRLFVRNHTSTPTIDPVGYRLRIFGDGLGAARGAGDALSLSLRDLRRLPATHLVTTHECTGNGRSFFGTQQGTPATGTQWTLGAVGAVRWEGVRLAHLLRVVGLDPDAVSIQATGLDPSYVSAGVDYGSVRRPFPVAKALDDALLAWGADGKRLLPDHGFPLRLVLPGWVGIASVKWLGSLEVSRSELTSPWNTTWYRMTGGDYPVDSPPLTVNPVRSAWELPGHAVLPSASRRRGRRDALRLHGRSWSGAGPITGVEVSADGGETWSTAALEPHVEGGWTPWTFTWPQPSAGAHVLMARATDAAGRTQPLTTPYNSGGYFFDAVVRHPVTVA
jgi:DMSO/TMAO reductase YedYZ molybdopterin-dependent catalytic subunit